MRSIEFKTLGGQQSFDLHCPQAPRATVLIAPALGVRASYYTKLCQALLERGLAATAVDLPGQGVSPIRASRGQDWGYPQILDHYENASEAIASVVPSKPIVLLGHSLGGQLALMLGGRDVPQLGGVIVVASGCPWWRTWQGFDAWRIAASTQACAVLGHALGYYPGDKVGFGGREAKTLIVQWAHAARTGRYRHGDFDGDALLARKGPPALGICIDGDKLAPESSMRLALDRLVHRDVTFERWRNAPHDGDHNRWPSQPTHVADRTAQFVDTLTGRARGAMLER